MKVTWKGSEIKPLGGEKRVMVLPFAFRVASLSV